MSATLETDTTARGASRQERAEPLRRTLERLAPEAREHFVVGLRILAEEIDAYTKGS